MNIQKDWTSMKRVALMETMIRGKHIMGVDLIYIYTIQYDFCHLSVCAPDLLSHHVPSRESPLKASPTSLQQACAAWCGRRLLFVTVMLLSMSAFVFKVQSRCRWLKDKMQITGEAQVGPEADIGMENWHMSERSDLEEGRSRMGWTWQDSGSVRLKVKI